MSPGTGIRRRRRFDRSKVPAGQIRRWTEERLGSVDRLWSPRSVRGDDGIARDRRQIDLRGLGDLSVTVECDQFLDLGEAWWRGAPLSFSAPSTSPHVGSWARRWSGGLLTTCGLRAVGPAPAEDGGMHGRALTTPATVTRHGGEWVGDNYEVVVGGFMREAAIFEQNVTVERTIRARIGRGEVRIRDVVRNEGFASERLRLLYHLNLGWPLVDEGSVIRVQALPPIRVDPVAGEWTAELVAPRPGAAENVDALIPHPDENGWSRASLRSPRGTEFSVAWRPEQLGFATVWRSSAAGCYAVGLEPGTCWPHHADAPGSGKDGRQLEPAESLEVELVLTIDDPSEEAPA